MTIAGTPWTHARATTDWNRAAPRDRTPRDLTPRDLTAGVLTRRVQAWLIDAVILFALWGCGWTFSLAFGLLTFGLGWSLFHLLPALPFVYGVLFLLSPLSATPGQYLRGLAVRRADDGGRPEAWQAVISTVGYAVTIASTGLLFLLALVTERHRALHDIAAGLVVVRRRALPAWDAAMTEPLTSFVDAPNMRPGAWPR